MQSTQWNGCFRSNVKRHAMKSSLQKLRYQTWRYEIETFLRVDFSNTAEADIDGLSHCRLSARWRGIEVEVSAPPFS